MQRLRTIKPQTATQIPPWPISKFFVSDTRMAALWLIIRVYAGYQWLIAGWGKLTGYSIDIGSFGQAVKGGAWVFTSDTGVGLKGFISGSLAQASGAHPAVQSWYASFLQHAILPNVAVFSYVITFGEVFVGLGLIVGAFTGIAAFFGIFTNMNYMLAGSVSTNPILLTLCICILLAWRISGYYGIDRYLLPMLGTPWTGTLASNQSKEHLITASTPVTLSGLQE
jgi:thiosulfate dehydrogenase (quinone) large subunit